MIKVLATNGLRNKKFISILEDTFKYLRDLGNKAFPQKVKSSFCLPLSLIKDMKYNIYKIERENKKDNSVIRSGINSKAKN